MVDETPAKKKAPAGWYPHPSMADTRRYWDGQAWTDNIAPAERPPAPAPQADYSGIATVLIVVAGLVGTVMAMQSASLLTGTGTQWTGVAITLGACVAAGFMRHSISSGFRILVAIAAVISLINVISLEQDLDDKRNEISRILP